MTQQLYIFAPENDMALAAGLRNYTPPPVARKIAADLSLLPLWYAAQGGVVLSTQTVPDYMEPLLLQLGVTARATGSIAPGMWECHPWGWSEYMCERLARAGVDRAVLPTAARLQALRNLSGRATSRTVLEQLSQRVPHLVVPPLPEVLRSAAAVEQFVVATPAALLKAPWSSSGRGIIGTHGTYDSTVAARCEGILRRQGYLMGEVLLDKVADLALEFLCDRGEVRFVGYSLFTTDRHGAYTGNILAGDDAIEHHLAHYINIATLRDTIAGLRDVSQQLIAPHYSGYFGFDAIIYRDASGSLRLHPCIELNLRMNMGVVAHCIAARYVAPGSSGYYRVEYDGTPGNHTARHRAMMQQHPLQIAHGRIVAGYLPLTPVNDDTAYCAYALIEEKVFF